MNKTLKENLTGYLSIAPSIIMIGGVGIIPILITITYSFQYRVLTDPLNNHFVGLENYIKLLTDPSFWEVFKNTAVFAIISMVVELFVGLVAALFMNSAKRYVGLIRTIILIPWAIPGIIIAYMFSFLFNDQLSVINVILEGLHIIDAPITFLANKHWAMFVVIVADTWKQFPYVALMLLAGLQTIPKELYESASVDGAGTIAQFFKITLPNLNGIM
ncbi:MAG: sugar ABC transporter permease, partial [Pseudobutyrivibrio sp.]|nr:sugar ABC transporter permease [Pseudobutyrivibrio sp.]